MVIEPSTDEMVDAVVTFGRDLLMREDPSLGAREIPFATLLHTVNAWWRPRSGRITGTRFRSPRRRRAW